jgi:THAP4-like, heme-binding beta-barrel domain
VTFVDTLQGVWRGDGEGHYPTIETFGYVEELTFSRLGDKPIISYAQRSWHHDDGRPLHGECGYLRYDGDRLELVVAQPTGYAEVHHGRTDGTSVEFGVTTFGRSATALPVQTVRRRWALDDGKLITELWMTYDGVIDGHHLRSVLQPAGGDGAEESV